MDAIWFNVSGININNDIGIKLMGHYEYSKCKWNLGWTNKKNVPNKIK
jgi:hypothetical protein